jgi:Fanconi anemia group M protein
LLHTYHCLELIETQGISPFLKYIENLNSRDKLSKSEKTFLNKDELREAVDIAQKHNHISHPKLVMLRQIVETQFQSEPDSLIIIFTQYRNTIESIEGVLTGIRDTKAQRFIGQGMQSNVRGMTQNQQKEVIENFRKREINVLIATSVAEEGIDIPNVNLVIFYEPLPSEIRTIQREGRTGRTHIGKVAILITEGTRDEAYLYAGMQKKKKMQRIVKELKSSRIWH